MSDEDLLIDYVSERVDRTFGKHAGADDAATRLHELRLDVAKFYAVNFRSIAVRTAFKWQIPWVERPDEELDEIPPESVKLRWRWGDRELWVTACVGSFWWATAEESDLTMDESIDVGVFARLWCWLHEHDCKGAGCMTCIEWC